MLWHTGTFGTLCWGTKPVTKRWTPCDSTHTRNHNGCGISVLKFRKGLVVAVAQWLECTQKHLEVVKWLLSCYVCLTSMLKRCLKCRGLWGVKPDRWVLPRIRQDMRRVVNLGLSCKHTISGNPCHEGCSGFHSLKSILSFGEEGTPLRECLRPLNWGPTQEGDRRPALCWCLINEKSSPSCATMKPLSRFIKRH